MLNVNFGKPRSDEQFRAYIGADGDYVVQLRQLNTGMFEVRSGDETEWRLV